MYRKNDACFKRSRYNSTNRGSFNRLRVAVSDRAAVVIFQVIDGRDAPVGVDEFHTFQGPSSIYDLFITHVLNEYYNNVCTSTTNILFKIYAQVQKN